MEGWLAFADHFSFFFFKIFFSCITSQQKKIIFTKKGSPTISQLHPYFYVSLILYTQVLSTVGPFERKRCQCLLGFLQLRAVSSAFSLLIDSVKNISNIVPMLDKVAKNKRTFLGSTAQEDEERLKLFFLKVNLFSVVPLMLAVVMVI